MKKVILTGASGLIGKEAIDFLLSFGFEVFCLSSHNVNTNRIKQVQWLKCNIFNTLEIKNIFETVKPSHLLHFAWCTHDDYLYSNLNFDFLKASIDLLFYFQQNGGTRAVFAGTCFEYKLDNNIISENSPFDPNTIYANCKNILFKISTDFSFRFNISFAFGTIFYVFGINEYKKRLVPHIINSLNNNQTVDIYNGKLKRDYMYSKDIAFAFSKLLNSDIQGRVNICSSNAISLEQLALEIGYKLDKTNLINISYLNTNEPEVILGDNSLIKEKLGFVQKYTISQALNEILNYNNK